MTVYTGTTFQTCALRVWGVWVSMRDFHAAKVSNRDLPPLSLQARALKSQALEYRGADPALADSGPVHLYKKLEGLGANRELLAVVGSWGDTLDDEEVLELLQQWNAAEGARQN